MYYALLEGRSCSISCTKISWARGLAKYSRCCCQKPLLLSDEQLLQLRAYVNAGGSLLRRSRPACTTSATSSGRFPAGRCVRHSQEREDHALPARILARTRSSTKFSTGFFEYQLDPRGGESHTVAPGENPILTVVPASSPTLRNCLIRSRRGRTSRHCGEAARQCAAWLLSGRYRAHDVAIGPSRSGAVAAELDPLGGSGANMRRSQSKATA